MRRARAHSYLLRDTGISVAFWLIVAVGVVVVGDPLLRGNLAVFASLAGLIELLDRV